MKKILCMLLCMLTIFSFIPAMAFAENSIISGTCSNGTVNYTFNEMTGELSLVGENATATIHSADWQELNLSTDKITKLYIGKGISNISLPYYQEDLINLAEVTVDDQNTSFFVSDNVIFSKNGDQKTLVLYPAKRLGETYRIPDDTTSIGNAAFTKCAFLKQITIPDSVKEINDITAADDGSDHFSFIMEGCPSESTLNGFWGTGKVKISCAACTPEKIKNLLKRSTGLILSHHLENGVCSTCGYSSSNPSPYGIESNYVLYPLNDISQEQYLIFNTQTGAVQGTIYWDTPITQVTIPDYIGGIAVTELLELDRYAEEFSSPHDAQSISQITIGDNVTKIGECAFAFTSITDVILPDQIKEIALSAFNYSTIRSVTMPISAYFKGSYFIQDSLTSFTFTKGLGVATDYDDTTYKSTPWYQNRNQNLSIIFEPGIKKIGNYMFAELSNVSTYHIPASVKEVGDNTFYRNKSLGTVTMEEGIEEVGYLSFAECENLTETTLPKSLTDIKYNSFDGDKKLVLIVSENSVAKTYAEKEKIPYKVGSSTSIITPSDPNGSSGSNTGSGGNTTIIDGDTDSSIQTPTFTTSDGIEITFGKDGTTANIKILDGYTLIAVIVNNVIIENTTTLTGLKTGDKVIINAKKNDATSIIDEINRITNIELVAHSKRTVLKTGKKAIKVYWTVPKSIQLDGYEVFRSTTRNSGYGKKPFFTTEKNTYYNSKKIKNGKTYYYKVRGFKIIDGRKVYTSWSTKTWRTAK